MKKKTINIGENKGITLIALVITIIVLLILAGVSIAMLTGENGILTQAKNAKDETEQAEKDEMSDLDSMESLINEYTGDISIPQVTDENPGQLEQENETTFVINSIEDLVFFSYDVTTNGNKYEGQTVKLGTNLDFKSDKSYVNPNRTDFDKYGYEGKLKEALTSGEGFKPIGETTTYSPTANLFYGTFDGNNNAICSLYMDINSKEQYIITGLFSTTYGEVRNIGLISTNITVRGVQDVQEKLTSVGGLVGISYNNIYNSYVTGSINVIGNAWMNVGGVCGVKRDSGNIEKVYNLANIECKNIAEKQEENGIICGGVLGGLQDCEEAKVEKCFNKGTINADGINVSVFAGGIIGGNSNNVNNCIIKNCYNNAKIQGGTSSTWSNYIGGIAGVIKSTNLSNCYNIGDVIGIREGNLEGDLFGIGGIIGGLSSNVEINNVFNKGNVISKNGNSDFSVGGIVGGTIETAANIAINNAYNVASIDANGLNSNQVGSIAGNASITFNNCYYLKGTYDIGVAGNETITGVTELDSIDKFPSVLEVVNEEGAFKEDVNNINNGYPILNLE